MLTFLMKYQLKHQLKISTFKNWKLVLQSPPIILKTLANSNWFTFPSRVQITRVLVCTAVCCFIIIIICLNSLSFRVICQYVNMPTRYFKSWQQNQGCMLYTSYHATCTCSSYHHLFPVMWVLMWMWTWTWMLMWMLMLPSLPGTSLLRLEK